MKKKKLFIIALMFMVFTLVFSGCGNSGETIKDIAKEAVDTVKGFSLGQWEQNTYTNEKFSLTVSLPEEWYIYNDEELAGIFGEVADNFQDSENEVEEGILIPLFFVADNQDVNIATMNMNLTAARSLLTPDFEAEYTEDTLLRMKSQMEQFGEAEINKIGDTEISGVKAYLITMDTHITGTDIVQYQSIYQVYKSGYLLTFTITSLDKQAIDDVVNYISFE